MFTICFDVQKYCDSAYQHISDTTKDTSIKDKNRNHDTTIAFCFFWNVRVRIQKGREKGAVPGMYQTFDRNSRAARNVRLGYFVFIFQVERCVIVTDLSARFLTNPLSASLAPAKTTTRVVNVFLCAWCVCWYCVCVCGVDLSLIIYDLLQNHVTGIWCGASNIYIDSSMRAYAIIFNLWSCIYTHTWLRRDIYIYAIAFEMHMLLHISQYRN